MNGAQIVKFFNSVGLSCSLVKETNAPQVQTLHLNLFDLRDHKKIKNAVKMLEMHTRQKITLTDTREAHFAVSFENERREFVDLLKFGKAIKGQRPCSVFFGVDENGAPIFATLDELPHLLVAGSTGGGKSVFLNSLITGLCCYNNPRELVTFLVDLKQCELTAFEKFPHTVSVATTATKAEAVFAALVDEMEFRYKKMSELGLEKNNGIFAKILVVVDELADLVLQSPKSKRALVLLLQKARACGMHFVLATQSPRAKILDGLLLANLPSRLALRCSSSRESVLILGHKNAENLLGSGDAILQLNGKNKETRLQCPFIKKETIQKLLKPRA